MYAKCATIQRSKILLRVEMCRAIFPKEEGKHLKVSGQCGQRCGGGHECGMFMRWQENDHGCIRDFIASEMLMRVKVLFHKYIKHLVPRKHTEGT